MSLCRYLPVPSDRMGIIWSLLSVKDSIILEYGPAGTTHFSMGFYGTLGVDWQQRLFTTHMNEDDVVMGDVTRLEEAIVELDKSYEPKVIFVVASSISAVIGTDIKGVCNYMQKEVQAKLVAFEQGGFRGDYSIGLTEVYKLLVNNLPCKEQKKRKKVFNIIVYFCTCKFITKMFSHIILCIFIVFSRFLYFNINLFYNCPFN